METQTILICKRLKWTLLLEVRLLLVHHERLVLQKLNRVYVAHTLHVKLKRWLLRTIETWYQAVLAIQGIAHRHSLLKGLITGGVVRCTRLLKQVVAASDKLLPIVVGLR